MKSVNTSFPPFLRHQLLFLLYINILDTPYRRYQYHSTRIELDLYQDNYKIPTKGLGRAGQYNTKELLNAEEKANEF